MTGSYCIWISNFGLEALKVPGIQTWYPDDRWKDMASLLPAIDWAQPPSAEILALISRETVTLTHPVGCPTGSCLTSPGLPTHTPCSELCLMPGTVLPARNPSLQGWRRCSGVWVLGVSGIWVTVKWFLDDCNFSTKRKKEKYINVLFSSLDQTRWADFRIICH